MGRNPNPKVAGLKEAEGQSPKNRPLRSRISDILTRVAVKLLARNTNHFIPDFSCFVPREELSFVHESPFDSYLTSGLARYQRLHPAESLQTSWNRC